MKRVGLFEAKTKFSAICEQVAANGEAVLVTRRGKPFVKIDFIPAAQSVAKSVWDRRAQYVEKHGRLTEELKLAPRARQTWRNPLEP